MTTAGAWKRLPANAGELFGLTLGDAELEKLESFLSLVETWSERMNLVGRVSRDELVERHLLDSLAPLSALRSAGGVADFGSGAGFPAIPLATLLPAVTFHLVESRRKRCSFLRQVVRTLGLRNATVVESRGEDWRPPAGSVDAVIGRAIAAADLAELATEVLAPGGKLLVMRKQGAATGLDGYREVAVDRYRLPGGERHEIATYQRIA